MIIGNEVESGEEPVTLLNAIDCGHNWDGIQVIALLCSVPRKKFLSVPNCSSQEEMHTDSFAIFRFQMSSVVQIVKKIL